MEGSKKMCPYCQSDKIIPERTLITMENASVKVSINKTPKKTGFFNHVAPVTSDLKADICGDCGNVQIKAMNPKRLWEAYQISLKNS